MLLLFEARMLRRDPHWKLLGRSWWWCVGVLLFLMRVRCKVYHMLTAALHPAQLEGLETAMLHPFSAALFAFAPFSFEIR
jgi:hypothetical protein